MSRIFLPLLLLAAVGCSREASAPAPAAPPSSTAAGKPVEKTAAPAEPPPAAAPAAPATPTQASPAQTPAKSDTAAAAPSAPSVDGTTPDGEALFQQHCATCHMANGSGVPYLQPAIRGSAWLSAEDPQPLLSLILRGSVALGEGAQAYENDMAPFAHLSDPEIAALATRVRQRFGQPPPPKPVTPADVAQARTRPATARD